MIDVVVVRVVAAGRGGVPKAPQRHERRQTGTDAAHA